MKTQIKKKIVLQINLGANRKGKSLKERNKLF